MTTIIEKSSWTGGVATTVVRNRSIARILEALDPFQRAHGFNWTLPRIAWTLNRVAGY